MIAFRLSDTIIRQVGSDVWLLQLFWVQAGFWGDAVVQVHLDPQMRAVPPDSGSNLSSSFGAGLPTLDVSPPPLTVSEDRKIVEFAIRNVRFSTKTVVQRKDIEFTWTSRNLAPNRVALRISLRLPFRSATTLYLTGLNVTGNIIDVVRRRRESVFYFPQESTLIRIPYASIAAVAKDLQGLPDTTVTGMSWPYEVHFWLSELGTAYLAAQIRKLRIHGPLQRPTRIAVSPFELAVERMIRRLFLQEMQVHFALGVQLLVVTPEALTDSVGTTDNSLAVYGASLALDFQGLLERPDDGELFVQFDSERIKLTTGELHAAASAAQPWLTYLIERGIQFSPIEEEGIARRVAILKSLAERPPNARE